MRASGSNGQRAYAPIAEALRAPTDPLLTTVTAIQRTQNFPVGGFLDGTVINYSDGTGEILGDVYVPASTSISADQIRENSLTIDGTWLVAINPAAGGCVRRLAT